MRGRYREDFNRLPSGLFYGDILYSEPDRVIESG